MTTETDPKVRATSSGATDSRGQSRSRVSIPNDLPRVPRRYGQWAGAVLFVLVSVLAAGWFWQQKSESVEVLVIAQPVPAGSVIERSDLKAIEVSGVDGAILAADASSVEGKIASVGLVVGQVLTPEMLTSDPLPGSGQRVVGVELDGTRAPEGLAPGDAVTVLAVPPTGDASSPAQLDNPTMLADDTTVVAVDTVEGAGTRFTLQVPSEAADRVAAYGAAGRIALVQAPLGGDD